MTIQLILVFIWLFGAGATAISVIHLSKLLRMARDTRHDLLNAMDAARVVIEEEFSKKVISQRAFDDALKDLGLKLTKAKCKPGRPRKTTDMKQTKTKKKEQ